jgi:hypothetical protein
MEVYSVKNTSEKKIVGPEYPQIETMRTAIDVSAQQSVYAPDGETFPDLPPQLDSFILNNKSKLTDVLSASMISFGFLVNEKVKNILSQYKLPDHRFYPASVLHNNKLHTGYFWFYFISDVLDHIDYSKTTFFTSDFFNNEIETCGPIPAADSFRTLNNSLTDFRKLNSAEVYFRSSLLKEVDLFMLSFGSSDTYISKSLYNDLLANKISGFEYRLAGKIIIEQGN